MNKDKKYVLYCHINKHNGKCYVGITSQEPEKRWNNGKGYYHNKYFMRAIEKYGWDGFNHIILRRDLSLNEARELEKEVVKRWKTNNRDFGYNMTSGGEGTYNLDEDARRRIVDTGTTHGDSKTYLYTTWLRHKNRHKYEWYNQWNDYIKFKSWALNNGYKEKYCLYRINNLEPYSPDNCVWEHKRNTLEPIIIEHNNESHTLSEWANIYGIKSYTIYNRLKAGYSFEEAVFNGAVRKNLRKVLCVETGIIYNDIKQASKMTGLNMNSIRNVCLGYRKTYANLHWQYIN